MSSTSERITFTLILVAIQVVAAIPWLAVIGANWVQRGQDNASYGARLLKRLVRRVGIAFLGAALLAVLSPVGQDRDNLEFYGGAGVHFGTRIVFDKGYIYFPVGERGGWHEAQDVENAKGKIYRLHDDGRVPDDNPRFEGKTPVPGLWSYGHRNPQGLDIDPRDGSIYNTEHGPRGGDELNVIRAGRNYGWPVITYGMNYNGTPWTDITAKEGMEQPLTYWTPSIAVSSMAFYTADRFPQWKGNILLASLAFQELRRLEISGETVTHQEVLFKDVGRLRDMIVGPDGYVYIAFNQPDRIARLVPALAGGSAD